MGVSRELFAREHVLRHHEVKGLTDQVDFAVAQS